MSLTLLALSAALAGDTFIINGEAADADEYPQAGALLVEVLGQYRMFICSSTLIAPDVVLTAAHCIDEDVLASFFGGNLQPSDLRFFWTRQANVTSYDGRMTDWPSDGAVSVDHVFHDSWTLSNLGLGLGLNYDIGLVFLDRALDPEEYPHAYLPTEAEAEQVAEGGEVVIVGWGQQTASNTYAGEKQMGVSWISELAHYEFQVGLEESDVRKCHGDSGGPSFLDIETDTIENMRLVGVTSHAYDSSDCTQTGGVDTRVDYYLDWIDQELRARCEDGTRAWCEEEGILAAPLPVVEDDVARSALIEDVKLTGCAAAGGGARWGLSAAGWLLALVGVGRRRR